MGVKCGFFRLGKRGRRQSGEEWVGTSLEGRWVADLAISILGQVCALTASFEFS